MSIFRGVFLVWLWTSATSLLVPTSTLAQGTGEGAGITFSNDFVLDAVLTPDVSCRHGEPFSWEGVAPACVAAPFQTLCSVNRARSEARQKLLVERATALNTRASEIYQRIRPGLVNRLGRLEDIQGSPSQRRQAILNWAGAATRAVADEVTRPTRPQMNRVVRRAVQTFTEMLRTRSGLPAPIADAISRRVNECTRRVELELARPTGATREIRPSWAQYNAFARARSFEIDHHESSAACVHLTERSERSGCQISLTPQAWEDCLTGSPTCMKILFHEFGHYMNPCVWRAASFQSQNPSIIEGARRSAQALEERAECLSETSHPREAVMADVLPPTAFGASFATPRCATIPELGARPGYPSQWDEAQADFWAASALALHLENLPASERRDAFGEIVGHWCVQADPGSETSEIPQVFADVNQVLSGIPPAASANPEPLSTLKPWLNHQAWDTRIERNFLLNQDLRTALGCDGLERRLIVPVGATCSPRRGLITPVPR
jgi:hypothetical protein